jgi:uncharacterized protein (DUF169 family)
MGATDGTEESIAMTDWTLVERRLEAALAPRRRPVAVAFRDEPPAGVSRFTGTEPSGCSFWRLAAEGRTFYTVPADHLNCAIGSYTHNVPLPPERAAELGETLDLMTGIGYVRMEEVPTIPRLDRTPGAVVYAPLGETPIEPDVVLVAGVPGRLMLLNEAATRAGVATHLPMLGRPTCMALPAVRGGGLVASLGCTGNRQYTDLADEELYVAIAGPDLPRAVAELDGIVAANATLAEYHATRRRQLTSD